MSQGYISDTKNKNDLRLKVKLNENRKKHFLDRGDLVCSLTCPPAETHYISHIYIAGQLSFPLPIRPRSVD